MFFVYLTSFGAETSVDSLPAHPEQKDKANAPINKPVMVRITFLPVVAEMTHEKKI